MNFASIRWRLPASYAAVALLAALSLGSLMLLVLNSYYTRQERAFLQSNAEVARSVVDQALQSSMPAQGLEDQVKGLAFLLQAQVRILDGSGSLLADSGVPDTNQVVSLSSSLQGGAVLNVGDQMDQSLEIDQDLTPVPEGTAVMVQSAPQGTEIASSQVIVGSAGTTLPVISSPYGFVFSATPSAGVRRSAQVVSVQLLSQPGTLEISNGPAYGSDILHSVTLAWLLASLAAVVLAGVVGFFASRQVTQPVLALTHAARRMHAGDLSSRAALDGSRQAQEFSTLAETFNQMAQRVQDMVSTLCAFVSDAAHELNTPLTALHTNLELALNEPDIQQREVFLRRAVEQDARLERLASGLLDLSRIESTQAAPELAALDLSRLAAEIGECFASRAEQAERSFTLDLPASPLPVRGNALQLQRMLDNLLENALKFTSPGGTIRLSLEGKDDQAVLCVADDGIGIPAEDLPHLFERFHRGRNAGEYPGTGLGLAIARAVAVLHGGKVEAQSAGRGRGSQFYIRLPMI
jgi:signal transduction histidine kinase